MILYTPPRPATSIPVIDLTDSFASDPAAKQRVAQEIHRACRESGFFYVSNHRIPQSLIDEQFVWATRLFDLPLQAKLDMHMKKSPSTAGYEPVGGQVLDSQDASAETAPADLKESFYFGMELPDDHPAVTLYQRSFGHNQWPAALPGFRAHTLACQAAMSATGCWR